jgi:hypothetical protein
VTAGLQGKPYQEGLVMVVIDDKAKEDIPMRPPNINDEPPHLRGLLHRSYRN